MTRSYTINEIDEMRSYVRDMLFVHGQPYYPLEMDARIENQLRTYMSAGISPEYLRNERCETLAAYQRAELQMMEMRNRQNKKD